MPYEQEAEAFHKACKRMGTDEQAIIDIVATHNNAQLDAVGQQYQAMFGFPIRDTLKKELSGHVHQLLDYVFTPHAVCGAEIIHKACKGAGTDEKALVDVLFTTTPENLAFMKRQFSSLYGKEMEPTIRADIAGGKTWERLLLSWLMNRRDARNDPQGDADALHAAAKGAGTREEVFIRILGTSTPEEYRQINQKFEQTYKKTLADVIKKEFMGLSEQTVLAAHYSLLSPALGVCYLLYTAMKGVGTDEGRLSRVTGLNWDLVAGVPQAYAEFGNLAKDIKHDSNKWYEKALLALWKVL